MERLRFKELREDSEIESVQSFITDAGEKVIIRYGTFGSSPAIRYVIKNRKGRIIENGGSIVAPSGGDRKANYAYALDIAMPRRRRSAVNAIVNQKTNSNG